MLRDKLNEIKLLYVSKSISYEEAKKMAIPIIDEMNLKSKEIAKKYNKKPVKIKFAGMFR